MSVSRNCHFLFHLFYQLSWAKAKNRWVTAPHSHLGGRFWFIVEEQEKFSRFGAVRFGRCIFCHAKYIKLYKNLSFVRARAFAVSIKSNVQWSIDCIAIYLFAVHISQPVPDNHGERVKSNERMQRKKYHQNSHTWYHLVDHTFIADKYRVDCSMFSAASRLTLVAQWQQTADGVDEREKILSSEWKLHTLLLCPHALFTMAKRFRTIPISAVSIAECWCWLVHQPPFHSRRTKHGWLLCVCVCVWPRAPSATMKALQ